MKSADVVVVDYGVGNLLSVQRGLEHCGATVSVESDPAVILRAPRVLLPGVGAFGNGMMQLRQAGLDEVVREVASRGTPLLGICLGMQMLLDESDEFEANAGLGLIPGRVVAIPSRSVDGEMQKIPHIGWSGLWPTPGGTPWSKTPLQSVTEGDAVYFVHSFMASPLDPADHVAHCRYGGRLITAAIARANVFGCQFHPEKSGEIGLRVLRSFLTL